MIRTLTATLFLATACHAVDTTAATPSEAVKTESKPARFKLPSMNELTVLAGDLAQKLDSKLTYLEQGTLLLKPAIDGLAQPANAKIAEKYVLLTQSLPKLRLAVNALKSGKASDSKLEIGKLQENLKTAEALFTQLKGLLPAAEAKDSATQKDKVSAK